MKHDYAKLVEHLKRTGRIKLLPRVLHELQTNAQRTRKLAPRKETAKDDPTLISGWRSLENGILTDRTGKRALIEIYQKVTK